MSKSLSAPLKLRRSLLRWYSKHQRNLPWRRTRDPYKIWISEIMLQQTQVATVIPYYKKWIKIFPSLSSLARAPLSKALKCWAGLGYYRRARMFHQAAQYVEKNLKGKIPKTAVELKKLPGIGRYTAGAIASIAWGEKTPVLDGNVIRILTRIFAIPKNVDRPETLEKLWAVAASFLPKKNPGDLNQSLMELGATVCFPSNPQCPKCPAKKHCAAHRKGKEIFYPVRSQKNRSVKLRMAALVLKNLKNEVWLEKQPHEGRWGGLWMFPFWDQKKKMLLEIGLFCSRPALFLTLPHVFTKYRITLEVYASRLEKDLAWKRPHGRWVSIPKLAKTAFPAPHKKIVQMLLSQTNHGRPPFPKSGLLSAGTDLR